MKLAICLLTYERTDYAVRTLITTLGFLRRFKPLHVHIADDGSSQQHRDTLYSTAREYIGDDVSITNSERGGYGRNVNLATQVIHQLADYVLVLEDDWELLRSFNPYQIIEDMETLTSVDCVRLGYLSFTQPLYGQVLDANNRKYLVLHPNSPEPHVFAGHPRIESVQRQREVGEWPEGELPGTTEFMVAHIPRARRGVAWPMDLVHPYGNLYAHIGSIRSY